MTRIAVACLLNARGDYLLGLPALRKLAAQYEGRLVLVVRRGAFETCLNDVAALAVVDVDATFCGIGYAFDVAAVASAIRRLGEVEHFISLNPWSSGSLNALVEALQPDESIGLGEGPWFTQLDLDFSCHSSLLAFRTASPSAGIAWMEAFSHAPIYPARAARFARQLREDVHPGPLIVIHRDTKRQKEWRDDRWIALLRKIVAHHPDAVILDIGLAALPDAKAVLGDHLLEGLQLPLAEAMAVAGAADIFIGVDSCFLHAADLARVPIVGLFFSTDPNEFGAVWAPHRHLVAANADALAADDVYAAFETLTIARLDACAGPRRGYATPEATRRLAGSRACPHPGLGLALGTIGLGTARWSFDVMLSAPAIIAEAAAAGCNVIDLAGNHGGGDACAVVGHTIARLEREGILSREQLFLCSKAGFTEHLTHSQLSRQRGWNDDHCLDHDYLTWEFERQRSALRVATIDAFMLQNPEDLLLSGGSEAMGDAIEVAFTLFERWRASGRIRFYGISTAEAFRVPCGHPLHIDLAGLWSVAERIGGADHGFRVIEMPISLGHLEAISIASHGAAGSSDQVRLTAMEWALRHEVAVLASAAIGGGTDLDGIAARFAGLSDVQDPAALQLQLVRALPGVTTALIGISQQRHLAALHELAMAPDHVW